MADINCSFAAGNFVEFAVNLVFGNGVERGSGLIEDDEWRILIKRSSKGNFLRFAAGNFDTDGVKIMIKICIKPI